MFKLNRVLCASAAALAASAPLQAADWTDNAVGLRVGSKFAEPGNASDVKKTILSFTHVSGDKAGTNFFTVDMLKSDSADPAAGAGSTDGAQELYAIYQRTFSYTKLSGSKLAWGGVRDVSLAARVDFGAKNTTFAPRPRKLRVGPTLSFDVPGFLDVGLHLYKESNHNGIVGSEVKFDNAVVLTAAWSIPITPAVSFDGFFDRVGEKGTDGFGGQTKPEMLLNAKIMADVGGLTSGKNSGLRLGVGYEYWKNKFGNDAATVPGSKQNTALLLAEYHF